MHKNMLFQYPGAFRNFLINRRFNLHQCSGFWYCYANYHSSQNKLCKITVPQFVVKIFTSLRVILKKSKNLEGEKIVVENYFDIRQNFFTFHPKIWLQEILFFFLHIFQTWRFLVCDVRLKITRSVSKFFFLEEISEKSF